MSASARRADISALVTFGLSLLLAAAVLAPSATAVACGDMMEPSPYGYSAEAVFVGRVLAIEPLEHRTQDGEHLTLYQVRVTIDESLKGSAITGQLATVYVIARTLPEHLDHDAQAEPTSVSLYDLPEVPELLAPYIFYANGFGEQEFVLYDNSRLSVQAVSGNDVETARAQLAMGYPIY